MPALRLLSLIAAMVLASSTCAWAQTNMSPALTQDLRDAEVQKQLIAIGVLDATAGRASGPDLGNAVAWFRKAYQFAGGSGPLTPEEKQKLKESYDKFIARTGLQTVTYTDAPTKTVLKLRVPAAFVGGASDWGVHQRPGRLERMQTDVCTDLRGVHLVEGAGHWVQQERADEVNRLLLEFLQTT